MAGDDPTIARSLGLIAACILLPGTLSAQVGVREGAAELMVSGRIQFQLESTSCTDFVPAPSSACASDEPGLDMYLRRARVAVEAKIDERLSLKLEPDFSDVEEVSLKDAWGRYRFSPLVSLKAGHFKRPFDGFFMASSTWLPFERSVSIAGVPSAALPSHSGLTKSFDLADRDIGFMFEGTTPGEHFRYWLGAFTGQSDARANDTNTEKQFVGRAQVTVDAGGAPLNVAGAVALTDAPFTAASGELDAQHYSNFELWGELGSFGREGLLVQAGLVVGDNPAINPNGVPIDLAAGDEFASILSWQGVIGYRVPTEGPDWLEAVAPVLRVSFADPNTDLDDDEAWGVTPGLALYFHQRNRLTLSWDMASFAASGIDSENAFRAQMQFHF